MGELRVKLKPSSSCDEPVESISLRLQLDEFSEVQYLKKGRTFPVRPERLDNKSSQILPLLSDLLNATVASDYQQYEDTLHDPMLWEFSAEERSAWSTETKLVEDISGGYSLPIVIPFMVATSNVNFPPGVHQLYDMFLPIDRKSKSRMGSKHSYHYTAVIQFSNGRTVEVPAGYTSFMPALSTIEPLLMPSASTLPLEDASCLDDIELSSNLERCIPEDQRTNFEVEVTLNDGGMVQPGGILRGRATVHRLTEGLTFADRLSVEVSSKKVNRWAAEQIPMGDNDTAAILPSECTFDKSFSGEKLSTSSTWFRHIFGDETRLPFPPSSSSCSASGILTAAKPYVDFEVHVPEAMVPDFQAYYTTFETVLQVNLQLAYPRELASCIRGDKASELSDRSEVTDDEAEKFQDGLWDMNTPIGEHGLRRPGTIPPLTARVPITGAASPLILTTPPSHGIALSFPKAQAIVTPEVVQNTSLRMLSRDFLLISFSGDKGKTEPDPTQHYSAGPYTGLLWKKKLLAEERKSHGTDSTTESFVVADDGTSASGNQIHFQQP